MDNDFRQDVKLSLSSQLLGVFAGTLMVMLIVWLTLPSQENMRINKQCSKTCMQVMKKRGIELDIFSAPSYNSIFKECHRQCIKVTNENSD